MRGVFADGKPVAFLTARGVANSYVAVEAVGSVVRTVVEMLARYRASFLALIRVC